MKKEEISAKIAEIEKEMLDPNFWQDKDLAQNKIKEMQNLKDELEGVGKYDKGPAMVTIFAGVGGDDAEDFALMLFEMYRKFSEKNNWSIIIFDEHQNPNGGYKRISFEVIGKDAYGKLKNESGVHRLVRQSPFNSSSKRQTSFVMVEVIPKMDKADKEIELKDDDIEMEYTKSSGPGGQNVNKRETAVRITHKETGLSTFVSNERSQAQNKEKALEIIKGKLYNLRKAEIEAKESGMAISKTQGAEWGNQIRSYILHPYKLVKDHRTSVETSDPESVLDGNLDLFMKK